MDLKTVAAVIERRVVDSEEDSVEAEKILAASSLVGMEVVAMLRRQAAVPRLLLKRRLTRTSYRVKTVTERLPKGLPDWFARSDANIDGQVAMSEFATSWSDSTLKEFSQFDLNHDGFITAKEALRGREQRCGARLFEFDHGQFDYFRRSSDVESQ